MGKRIPTFIDGNFIGYYTLQEIEQYKKQARKNAEEIQKNINAEYLIYGYFSLDNEAHIETARFYSGISKTADEYHTQISTIPNALIYSLIKHN